MSIPAGHLELPEFLLVPLPDGRRMGLTRYGNPAHPVVLFHHGFGSSSLDVPPCAALLAKLGVQIIAPDRPGIGPSDVDRRLSFESVAADIVFALDALGITGPVGVLGWSVGGLHALALAALYPERVTVLQLVSTTLPLSPPFHKHLSQTWKFIRRSLRTLPGVSRALFAWLHLRWARDPEGTIDWFIRMMRDAEQSITGHPPIRALLRDAAARGAAHRGRGMYYESRAWCRPLGFSLADVRCPTQLWHGEEDGVWSPDNIPYFASCIPGAQLQLLPHAGHMLYLAHWDDILIQMQQDMAVAVPSGRA
jgi:pimeloyl-ACP methyl ester carboxylesterase